MGVLDQSGILRYCLSETWDIGISVRNLGFWPLGIWDIGNLKLGYWDIGHLKLDIGILALRNWDIWDYKDPL